MNIKLGAVIPKVAAVMFAVGGVLIMQTDKPTLHLWGQVLSAAGGALGLSVVERNPRGG